MPEILTRSDWRARAPKSTPVRVNWLKIDTVDLHWPASMGVRIGTDKTVVASWLRGWQNYHMNPDNPKTTAREGQNWQDIAYNVAVDLAGRVWMLRGWDVQDGGVSGLKTDVTVLAVMGSLDKVTDEMKASILWCFEEFERRARKRLRRTHHGALQKTDCPGPELTAWSNAGFPAPSGAPADPKAYPGVVLGKDPTPDGRRVDRHPAVSTVQTALGLRADGVFGPATEAAVKEFQRARGLEPVDGIVGRETWVALVAPVTPEPIPNPNPNAPNEPISEEDIMASTEEVVRALLDADVMDNWDAPATGETVRAAFAAALHNRDVKTAEGPVRTDVVLAQLLEKVNALTEKVDALQGAVAGPRDAAGGV